MVTTTTSMPRPHATHLRAQFADAHRGIGVGSTKQLEQLTAVALEHPWTAGEGDTQGFAMDIDQRPSAGLAPDLDDLGDHVGGHAVGQAARDDEQVVGPGVLADVIEEAPISASVTGGPGSFSTVVRCASGSTTTKQTRVPAPMVVWRSPTPSATMRSRSESPTSPPRNP